MPAHSAGAPGLLGHSRLPTCSADAVHVSVQGTCRQLSVKREVCFHWTPLRRPGWSRALTAHGSYCCCEDCLQTAVTELPLFQLSTRLCCKEQHR